MQSSQRSFKLKHLRLTLSKYDAKYSKTSTILNDDSSHDTDEGTTELEESSRASRSASTAPAPLPLKDMLSHHQDAAVVHKLSNKSAGETVLPNSIAVALMSGHEQTVSRHSTLSMKDNSMMETASSLPSVETDSEIGFNNVHSVSSLAESVLPLDEEINLDISGSSIRPKLETLPHSVTVLSVSSSSGGSLRIIGRDMARNVDFPITCNKSESNESIKVATIRDQISQKKSEKSSLVVENLMLNLENTESLSSSESTSFNLSKETVSLKGMINRSMYDFNNEKVSVAIQTSSCDEDVRKKVPASLKVKRTVVAAPLIKPLQLPILIRDDGIASNSPLQGMTMTERTSPLENEVEKLVSYHLDLIKKFLECQHRIYMANYKAVQLLERGYKEYTLERTIKMLDGQGTTEDGTAKVQHKNQHKMKRHKQ